MDQARAKKFLRLYHLAVIAKHNFYGAIGTGIFGFSYMIIVSFFFSGTLTNTKFENIFFVFLLASILSGGTLVCIVLKLLQREERRSGKCTTDMWQILGEMRQEMAAEAPPKKPPKERGLLSTLLLLAVRIGISILYVWSGLYALVALIDLAKGCAYRAGKIAKEEGAVLSGTWISSLLFSILPTVLTAIMACVLVISAHQTMQEDILTINQSLAALEGPFQELGSRVVASYPENKLNYSYYTITASDGPMPPVESIRHKIDIDFKGRIYKYSLYVEVDSSIPFQEQLQYLQDAYGKAILAVEEANVPWTNGKTDNMVMIPENFEEIMESHWNGKTFTMRGETNQLGYIRFSDRIPADIAEFILDIYTER